MERAKILSKFMFFLLIGVILFNWYTHIPGTEDVNYKNKFEVQSDFVVEHYGESQLRPNSTYYAQETYTIVKKRSLIPFVYNVDTLVPYRLESWSEAIKD